MVSDTRIVKKIIVLGMTALSLLVIASVGVLVFGGGRVHAVGTTPTPTATPVTNVAVTQMLHVDGSATITNAGIEANPEIAGKTFYAKQGAATFIGQVYIAPFTFAPSLALACSIIVQPVTSPAGHLLPRSAGPGIVESKTLYFGNVGGNGSLTATLPLTPGSYHSSVNCTLPSANSLLVVGSLDTVVVQGATAQPPYFGG